MITSQIVDRGPGRPSATIDVSGAVDLRTVADAFAATGDPVLMRHAERIRRHITPAPALQAVR